MACRRRSVTPPAADEERRAREDEAGDDTTTEGDRGHRDEDETIISMESNWFLMNPRDDAVPLGCHLNLLDDDDDDDEENHGFDEHSSGVLLMHNDYARLDVDYDDGGHDHDHRDEELLPDDLATVKHSNSRPGSSDSPGQEAYQQSPPPPPRKNSSPLPSRASSDPIPVRPGGFRGGGGGGSGGPLKRTLSEEQLLVDERVAEYRDSLMFQRIVNGICRQQQSAVFDHPKIVNDRCLVSIISARNMAASELLRGAGGRSGRRDHRGSGHPRGRPAPPRRLVSADPVSPLVPREPKEDAWLPPPPGPLGPPTLLLPAAGERRPRRPVGDGKLGPPPEWAKAVRADPARRLLRPVTLVSAVLDATPAAAAAAAFDARSCCDPSHRGVLQHPPLDGRYGWNPGCRAEGMPSPSPSPSSMDDAIFDLEM